MIKLKDSQYHQLIDRLNVISDIIDSNLQQHPIAKINPEVKEHIQKAVDELYIVNTMLQDMLPNNRLNERV